MLRAAATSLPYHVTTHTQRPLLPPRSAAQNLTQFEDDLGACERILKTKMPFGYLIHLRTFLVLWLLTLPFALITKVGWGTIPTACAILYALAGLEMIGVEIENPFGHDYNDLPLDSITDDTIGANLLELLQRHTNKKKGADAAGSQVPTPTPATSTVVKFVEPPPSPEPPRVERLSHE